MATYGQGNAAYGANPGIYRDFRMYVSCAAVPREPFGLDLKLLSVAMKMVIHADTS